jgi:hypothetical protein
MTQTAGAAYGQGVHGRTIDAGQTRDTDSLHAALTSAPRVPAWVAYYRGKKTPYARHPMSAAAMTALVGVLAKTTGVVAKEMRVREAFEVELRTNARVLRAYGRSAERFTTLRAFSLGMVGLFVPATGLHYTLQARCDVPLDRLAFGRPNELDAMVRDLLASFARLHDAGMLHADVKLDNMMLCGRSYKLVDWGAAIPAAELRRRYLSQVGSRPKNCLTPLAWFAYGLAPVSLPIFLVRHAMLFGLGTTSLAFQGLMASALASAQAEIERLEAEHADTGAARDAAMRRHWRSFDLFNLGMAIAHLACSRSGGLKKAVHARLMRLARALTHYDPPYYCDDAAAALQWYSGQ